MQSEIEKQYIESELITIKEAIGNVNQDEIIRFALSILFQAGAISGMKELNKLLHVSI